MCNNRYTLDGKIHDAQRLRELQKLPLDNKILITQARLIEWYKYWNGQCYVGLSGGKDSSVCADIAAQVCELLGYKLVLWFANTGLEYPEVRRNVDDIYNYLKQKYNIEIELVKDYPKDRKGNRITFRQVLDKYGYPLISKDVSNTIAGARRSIAKGEDSYRLRKLKGTLKQKNGQPSKFTCAKWSFLLDAPFAISSNCCDIMKKRPAHKFEKERRLVSIVATMANESYLRLSTWFKFGCNAFNEASPQSRPMSFWTEDDVLEYIKLNDIPLASVYGEILKDEDGGYYTSGVSRTGCMFCLYGIQYEKEPNRFQQMKLTHPKLYDYCIRECDKGCLGIGRVLDFINIPYGKDDMKIERNNI